jgi:hypothetical protein
MIDMWIRSQDKECLYDAKRIVIMKEPSIININGRVYEGELVDKIYCKACGDDFSHYLGEYADGKIVLDKIQKAVENGERIFVMPKDDSEME